MSAINEQTKWEDEVYLLAREDRVEGGIYGPSNKQARQLANRMRSCGITACFHRAACWSSPATCWDATPRN